MGFAAGTLYSRLRTRGWGALVCGIVGEIPMVAGYWLYDALLVGSLAGSAAGGSRQPGPGRVRRGGYPPCWPRHCAAAAMCAGSFPRL